MIEVEGFYIISWSDPSVGISEQRWEITGGLVFDSKEELEEYRENLKTFWEYHICEVSHVITFEEYQDDIKEELVCLLNNKQKHIILHTCGLDWKNESYRNRFITGKDTSDFNHVEDLVNMEIMDKKERIEMYGGMNLYFLTDHGMDIAKYIKKKHINEK